MLLRQPKQSDQAAWQKLYYSYLAFYESQPIQSSTDLLWSRLVSAEPLIQSYVAEVDGEIVGFVHFHFQLSTWTHTWHCYLEDLFVSASFRGIGIAEALILEVKAAAEIKQCSELYWITRNGNGKARSLYNKLANETDFVRYEILLETGK